MILLRSIEVPQAVTLAGDPLVPARFDAANGLLWLRFINTSHPRELRIQFAGK